MISLILRALSILILSGAILTGCVSTRPLSTGQSPARTLSAQEYLRLAQTEPSKQSYYYLQATEAYLNNHQAKLAYPLLQTVQINRLSPSDAQLYQLVSAHYQIEMGQLQSATDKINTVLNNDNPNTANQILAHRLLAKIFQAQSNVTASIEQLSLVQPLLNNAALAQQNLLDIWQPLQKLHAASLRDLLATTHSNLARGWIELALIDKNYLTPDQLINEINNWQSHFPDHPANLLINNKGLILNKLPQHVALLLPLQGPLADSAEAVRNGFFAAFYAAKSHQRFAPTISVHDTSSGDIASIYQQAISQGADFVVGPLTKENVASLSHSPLTVPTLALNSIQDNREQAVTNLLQFDLSPRNEAKEVANKAWQNNYNRAVIFAGNDDWSNSIARAFQQQWQSLGGRVVSVVHLSNPTQLDAQIRQLLKVQTLIAAGNRQKSQFRLSQDINFDFVFLATAGTQAQQILPLLRFYSLSTIPVYATSLIYDGNATNLNNNDLNGIYFCSMPWLIDPATNLSSSVFDIRNRILSLWSSSFNRNPKLYALGVDAYNLIPELNKLVLFPGLGISGATGKLYIDNNHYINRQLTWAEMVNGNPESMPQH
jgi:outer membrane PBP1 activator LpoA protein